MEEVTMTEDYKLMTTYPTMYDSTQSCKNLPRIPTFLLRMCTTLGVSYQKRKLDMDLKHPIVRETLQLLKLYQHGTLIKC